MEKNCSVLPVFQDFMMFAIYENHVNNLWSGILQGINWGIYRIALGTPARERLGNAGSSVESSGSR
jgi:hypothetical protein